MQWETTEKIWRLHFLPPGASCADELSSIKPAIGVDFDTGDVSKLPHTGTIKTGVGVAFIPADRPDIGAFTANSGVTLTFTHVDSSSGGRWTGHLNVSNTTLNTDVYSFDGPIDAQVCPPGAL